jgi:hypothetical protein
MMDGGGIQILERNKQDADRSETDEEHNSPERNGHWREDKIGLLMTMTSTVFADRRGDRLSCADSRGRCRQYVTISARHDSASADEIALSGTLLV